MRGSGNGRPVGEEDESDSPGPLDRKMRRRRPARKARTKREKEPSGPQGRPGREQGKGISKLKLDF
jgi:hypothetical protein